MIDILISGGPVMIPLGLLSLVALTIIIERLWVLRRGRFLEQGVVSALTNLIAQREFDGAVDYCRRHQGPFPELVTALIENRHAPYDELREVLEDTGRHQLSGLQRGLPALATIVAGSPLLGLLGTVVGMIKIFTVVGSSGTAVAERLSAGIAEALVTTATGLIIAIPALFIHAYLEGRAVNILEEIEVQLLDFIHLVRRPSIARESQS
jgi:biopolymer transport protein ExbB